MKKKSPTLLIRMLFYGLAILGLLIIFVSLQSFETVSSVLDKISKDGRMESFTRGRYDAVGPPSMVVGLCFTILSCLALIRWENTQRFVDSLFTQIKDFNGLFRRDAHTLYNGFHDGVARQSRGDLLLLGGLVLAALVIRLSQLNAPLLADEAYTYNAFASRSLWQTISDYHLPNNHVLLSIMINILTHLFGNKVWLIRLPTMIAGMLMVPAGYVLADRLYGRNAAVLSAALIAVFPILVMYSVFARGYGIVSLITLLILGLGDYVRRNKNRFAWFLLILFSAAGFYTVPIMAFPFGALYFWLILSCIFDDLGSYRSRLEFIKYWLVAGVASALLTLLLYAPILVTDPGQFFNNKFVAPVGWDMLPSVVWDRVQGTWHEWTSSIPSWIILLGSVGLIVGLIFHRKISKIRIPLQVAFLVWIVMLVLIRRPDMGPRMWLFLAAPLLIWAAGGIVGGVELFSSVFQKTYNLAQIIVGAVVISVIIGGLLVIPTISGRWDQKSDIENTVLYLKDHLREGDLVNASTNSLSLIRYYFNVYDISLKYVRRSGEFQRAFLAVSRETDTLKMLAPVDGSGHPLINLDTARIILRYEGLTVYECYPVP